MNQVSLSNSPFLNRPIHINNYGTNTDNLIEPELEKVEIKKTETPKIKKQTGEKKVISAKKNALPDEVIDNEPLQSDPDVELFEFENEQTNQNESSENIESEEEAEKMSSTTANETAKAIIMVVNQIVTMIGYNACLIDENSIIKAVENGELPDEIHQWADKVNENTKKEIPFSSEQQVELVRALAIILKESNYSAISPTHMAILSICMVFFGQIKKLVDLNKSNAMLLEEALKRVKVRESNIPEVQVEKEVKQTPIKNQKVSSNEKQLVT